MTRVSLTSEYGQPSFVSPRCTCILSSSAVASFSFLILSSHSPFRASSFITSSWVSGTSILSLLRVLAMTFGSLLPKKEVCFPRCSEIQCHMSRERLVIDFDNNYSTICVLMRVFRTKYYYECLLLDLSLSQLLVLSMHIRLASHF